MKRLLCILTVLLTTNILLAQTENYQSAIDRFQTNYNAGNYDSIFNDFSPEMKKALPLETTRQFLSGLKSQAGDLIQKEFAGFSQGTYATYKSTFGGSTLEVNISLDDDDLINGLFIKPWEKTVDGTQDPVNGLTGYPAHLADEFFSKIKDFPDQTELSIALIRNDDISYYGVLKDNGTLRPVVNHSKVFEVGSITKVFTSTVLASLVEVGDFKLTDAVNPYFPFSFRDQIELDFKDLANHTSGLPRLPENLDLSDETNPYKSYGKSEIEYYLTNLLELNYDTTAEYLYSNLGAGLLGYSLGLSQKSTIQNLVQELVFDKYGMRHSFTSSRPLNDQLVEGRNSEGVVTDNWDFNALWGAGGALSTAEDLARFATAQFDRENTALARTRKATFVIDDSIKVGLGWHILKSESGQEFVWHNGGTGGYTASMAVDVSNETAVIILSNVSTFHSLKGQIDELCFELLVE